jgi:hypothetical protein
MSQHLQAEAHATHALVRPVIEPDPTLLLVLAELATLYLEVSISAKLDSIELSRTPQQNSYSTISYDATCVYRYEGLLCRST